QTPMPSLTGSSSFAVPRADSACCRSNTVRSAAARNCNRTYFWRAAMSWSFLNRAPMRRRTLNNYARLSCATIMMVEAPVFAAQWYVQPIASITVESDSNLELDPAAKRHTQGYLANVSTLFGIATPTSDFTIRPRVEYRDYPQSSQDNRLEEYLDFSSRSKWVRSSAS